MPRTSRRRAAFTLVELFVSVAVIGVLIGIALPTLRFARRSAEIADCQVRTRSILQAMQARAGDEQGRWPNIAPPGELHQLTFNAPAGIGYSWVTGVAYFDQTLYWGALLHEYIPDTGGSSDPYGCPAVVRGWHSVGYSRSPTGVGAASFMYSAALVSDPSLWRDSPEGEAARASEAERRRAWVLTSAVAHPSKKVALAEIADHHGSGRALDDPGAEAVNAAFADGHAERVDLRRAQPAFRLSFSTRTIWRPERPVPFSAAKDGYLGHDY